MQRVKLSHGLAFLSGLLLGWLAIGWWLWPVEYVDEATYRQITAQNQASDAVPDWLLIPGVVVSVAGFGAGGWLLWRRRTVSVPPAVASFDRAFVSRTTEEYIPVQAKPNYSLAHASLTFGPDQMTDQHLPIERDGQHLGEFGVSQVEDEQAWDVWLFDQKALVTVTKVLANQASEELAGRGEILTWKIPFTLETANLKMDGRAVKPLEGGMTIELIVEGKDETE